MIVFIVHTQPTFVLLNCNNKLGCIHLHQNKVTDYLHIFFVASFWPQHVGVDEYRSVPEGNFQGWEL